MTDGCAARGPRAAVTSFVGSFVDGPDRAEIVLRGVVDLAVVVRVGVHIDDLCTAGMRYLTIEATGVDRVDPALLDLLGLTQHRLGLRRGMVSVRGLRPSLLAVPDQWAGPGVVPAPAPAGG